MKLAKPEEFSKVDKKFLKQAWKLLPRLPMEDLDVLVVDEMGKDVSGAGMDPNVIGFWRREGGPRKPDYRALVVLDLTPQSHGNATGIGMADLTGPDLIEIGSDPTVTMPRSGEDTWVVGRDTNESAYLNLEVDGGSVTTIIDSLRYHMRAYRALTPGFVYWDVLDEPDLTGSASGYDPSELTDIIVNGRTTEPSYGPLLMGEDQIVSGTTSPKLSPG